MPIISASVLRLIFRLANITSTLIMIAIGGSIHCLRASPHQVETLPLNKRESPGGEHAKAELSVDPGAAQTADAFRDHREIRKSPAVV